MTRETEVAFNEARDATLVGSGVAVAEITRPRREGWRVSAQWSFEVRREWSEDVRDVTIALQARGYRAMVAASDELAFSKRVSGDLYTVSIRHAPTSPAAGPKLALVATFLASPN